MVDVVALPGFRAGLAALGDGPEAPHFLAGGLIESREEAARAFVAAGDPGNYQIADGEGSGSGVVVQMPVGHLGFPQQSSGETVQSDDVGIVGDHEQAVAGSGCAAIDAAGGVADQILGSGTLVVPDLASGAGVQRVALIGAGHVHDSVDDDGGYLQAGGAEQREDPLGRKAGDVGLVDLIQRAVTVAADLAVVGGPVGLAGDGAIHVAVFAQQMDFSVGGEELHVLGGLVGDGSFEGPAARHFDGYASLGRDGFGRS